MKSRILPVILFSAAALSARFPALAKKRPPAKKPAAPIGWAYVRERGEKLLSRPGSSKAAVAHLARGSLAEILAEKTAHGITWAHLMAVDPATLDQQAGWIESDAIEKKPYARFPADAQLLEIMGGTYLDDFVAAHTVMARFLVRQGSRSPLLVCYVGSRVLLESRLQAFREEQGKYVLGPFLDFPYASMATEVHSLEVRDLLGDGNECMISTESAPAEAGSSSERMVIRRVQGDRFQTLWQAPLKLQNLSSYPAKPEPLKPAAKNIGQPGTITAGKVTFETQNGVSVPEWKGKVEFYVIGRDEPVESIPIEKVCPWTGTTFAPLE